MSKALTNEQWRILYAIRDGRLSVNEHGRYLIAGGPRPSRKDRERLAKRGLIDWAFVGNRGLRLTVQGERIFKEGP